MRLAALLVLSVTSSPPPSCVCVLCVMRVCVCGGVWCVVCGEVSVIDMNV